jgi:hypothetical protein
MILTALLKEGQLALLYGNDDAITEHIAIAATIIKEVSLKTGATVEDIYTHLLDINKMYEEAER